MTGFDWATGTSGLIIDQSKPEDIQEKESGTSDGLVRIPGFIVYNNLGSFVSFEPTSEREATNSSDNVGFSVDNYDAHRLYDMLPKRTVKAKVVVKQLEL